MAGTVPTSGALALSKVQSSYARGGVNPIKVSEYYRGGAYVLASKVETTTVNHPGTWTNSQAVYIGVLENGVLVSSIVRWPSGSSVPAQIGAGGYWTYNGVNFQKAGILSSVNSTRTDGKGNVIQVRTVTNEMHQYQDPYTSTVNTTVQLNTNVPKSGTIKFSQWRGGHN